MQAAQRISHTFIQELLNAHARTFALTLRLLPRTLREPLGITYLLARASDTVADTTSIPSDRRLALLEELAAFLDGEKAPLWQLKLLVGEGTPSERELLAAVPSLISLLEQLPDKREMFRLWRRILEGQLFDLRRFSPGAHPLTREELERYCLLVAGSVGESWTGLIAKHAPKVLRPSPDGEEGMIRLGINYGKGLQMLNIIRDRAADGKLGRIYLQEKDVPEMIPVTAAWLKEGREYCSRLRPGRIRYASEIPLKLALRTLARIREPSRTPGVKITRREVYGVLLKTLPSLVLPGTVNPAS